MRGTATLDPIASEPAPPSGRPKPRKASSNRRFISRCKARNGSLPCRGEGVVKAPNADGSRDRRCMAILQFRLRILTGLIMMYVRGLEMNTVQIGEIGV